MSLLHDAAEFGDVEVLRDRLEEAAAAEPHIAPQLRQWQQAMRAEQAEQPPESVMRCAVQAGTCASPAITRCMEHRGIRGWYSCTTLGHPCA